MKNLKDIGLFSNMTITHHYVNETDTTDAVLDRLDRQDFIDWRINTDQGVYEKAKSYLVNVAKNINNMETNGRIYCQSFVLENNKVEKPSFEDRKFEI